jgi:hypothetical protein
MYNDYLAQRAYVPLSHKWERARREGTVMANFNSGVAIAMTVRAA